MGENTDTRIVLGSLRYKSSPNRDSILNVSFEQSNRQDIQYDRNLNVDLAQVFDDERQKSTIIRPSSKITFLFKNTYTGETDYQPYSYNLYYVNETSYSVTQNANPGLNIFWGGFPQYSEFDLIRSDNNVVGYTTPPSEHIDFITKSATTYNWGFYISYPYRNDDTKVLNYQYDLFLPNSNNSSSGSWVVKNGIPFNVVGLSSNGNNLISFKCFVKHGIFVGEYVEILDPNGNPLFYNNENVYQVYSLGDGVYGNEEYYVNIYNYGYLSTYLPGTTGTIRRIIDINNSAETKSKYYIREHKILTNIEDQILTTAGFDWNVFETNRKFENRVYTPNNLSRVSTKEANQSYNLTFSRDIDISNLKDNLNRPITELYVTISHRGYFGWFYEDPSNLLTLNPNTSLVKEGWGFNLPTFDYSIGGFYHRYPSNWWRLGVTGLNSYAKVPYTRSFIKTQLGVNYTFYYNEPLISGDTLYGDFCEWNDFDQKERVISDYYRKLYYNSKVFNTTNPNGDSTPTNPYGFYYKVHNPITIRVYSNYIEEGEKEKVSEIPDYAYYSQYRRTFRWRDIYTYGFIDDIGNGVDYPFLNGVHHPFKYFVFRLIPEGTNAPNPYQLIDDPTQDDCE